MWVVRHGGLARVAAAERGGEAGDEGTADRRRWRRTVVAMGGLRLGVRV